MFRHFTLPLLGSLMLAASQLAMADDRATTADQLLTLEEAAELIQRETGAEVLGAEARREGGRDVYRFKILKDGYLRSIRVNPERRIKEQDRRERKSRKGRR